MKFFPLEDGRILDLQLLARTCRHDVLELLLVCVGGPDLEALFVAPHQAVVPRAGPEFFGPHLIAVSIREIAEGR
ncbi:hypothetical protein D3C86_1380060 [compost metagenome]